MKGGGEYDAFTAWRRLFGWGSGELRYWKRRFAKRVRRETKRSLRDES
jgi:hypothetical protein